MNKQHCILGFGNVGRAVAEELEAKSINYKIVSRTSLESPKYIQGDAMNLQSLIASTKDSSHLYLTLGLPYNTKIWQQQWPVIIQNVIEAARINSFKIIFFDNLYMYGPQPLQNPITEDHPQSPPSQKGLVRKEIADALLAAHKNKKVEVVIGRSADFYGPHVINSLLYINGLQNLLKGKKAQFIGNPHTKHSYTYVEDAGKALVCLAHDTSAYGEAWHLPTAGATYTTAELLKMMADQLNAPQEVIVMPKILVKALKVFIPILKEVDEMTYQTESMYNFSSDKFMQKYPDFKITDYQKGIKTTVESFYKK